VVALAVLVVLVVLFALVMRSEAAAKRVGGLGDARVRHCSRPSPRSPSASSACSSP
jgi:hypothetical protein